MLIIINHIFLAVILGSQTVRSQMAGYSFRQHMASQAAVRNILKSFVRLPSFGIGKPRRLLPDRHNDQQPTAVTYTAESESRILRLLRRLTGYQRAESFVSAMEFQQQESSPFMPPEAVRGIQTLDRHLFSRSVSVPALRVNARHIGALTKGKILQSAVLKMPRIKPIAQLAATDPESKTHKLLLLDPRKCKIIDELMPEEVKSLDELGIDVQKLEWFEIELGYENWTLSDILRAVLPADTESVSGFSIIGHIAHLNLKMEVMDYKYLIGQVVLDKNPCVKTVVNKLNIIDNTFRNFQMELLAGADNFVTRAKENGFVFELDFSKVYWNPRLGAEHQRVVDLLDKGDNLFDVFAGVGPFAVPAAKKGVTVFANDLNPDSYAALVTNAKLNKVPSGAITAYNLDGRAFIRTVLKPRLLDRLQKVANAVRADDEIESGCKVGDRVTVGDLHGPLKQSENACEAAHEIHPGGVVPPNAFGKVFVVMNLPALALEFLDVFPGLLASCPELKIHPAVAEYLPTVMSYAFSKSSDPESDVRVQAERVLGRPLPAGARVRMVRNVAPNKEMLCLVFQLTPSILFEAVENQEELSPFRDNSEADEPSSKRTKIC